MSIRLRKRVASLTFFLQKTYWKVITAKPSLFTIAAIVVAAAIFLLGGGVYDLLEKPLVAIIDAGGRIIVFYPYTLNEQFLMESIVVMIAYAIGVAGFLLTYQSTKYAYRPRQAFILLLAGSILIITAYLMSENFLLARWSGT